MKRLLLLSVVLFAFVACNKDADIAPSQQQFKNEQVVPYFYGMAMLDESDASTRGVADALKVWSVPMAENNLTVKFLDDPASDSRLIGYMKLVKETAKEWEQHGGVKFKFVSKDEPAMIRIKFELRRRGAQASWSYTGTDHMQLWGHQNEPTMMLSQWPSSGENRIRGDVLRAFGQVLGLELEHRTPCLFPIG